jgi:hypothetical protein
VHVAGATPRFPQISAIVCRLALVCVGVGVVVTVTVRVVVTGVGDGTELLLIDSSECPQSVALVARRRWQMRLLTRTGSIESSGFGIVARFGLTAPPPKYLHGASP